MEVIGSHNGLQTILIDEELEITVGNSSVTTSDSVPDGAKILNAHHKVTEFGDTGTVATMDIGYTAGSTDELWNDTACTAITDKDSLFQEQFNVTTEKFKSGADTLTVTLNAAVVGASVKVRVQIIYEQLIDIT